MHRYARNALIAATAAFVMGGCARQYHCYQDGPCCTGYHYCTPAPLPYAAYRGCPTPVASSYVGRAGYAPVTPPASPDKPATPSGTAEPPPPAPPTLEPASFTSEARPVRPISDSPFLKGLIRIDSVVGSSQNPRIHQSPLDRSRTALKD